MARAAVVRINAEALHAAGLRGRGETIAVCDTGLDLGRSDDPHPSLAHVAVRAASYGRRRGAWSDPHGHGTHIAGAIFGRGASADGVWAGVAPEADLYLQSIYRTIAQPFGNRPVRIAPMLRLGHDEGARVHANAWDEASTGGVYSVAAEEIDTVAYERRDLLVIVAVGNGGTYLFGDEGPAASTLRSPAPAKNALAVGASKNDRPEYSRPYREFFRGTARGRIPDAVLEEGWSLGPDGVTPFSGRGPTQDGRVKPDIVAPGTAVVSALSRHRSNIFPTEWGDFPDPHHALIGGTSVSVALAAGAAALARQCLREAHGIASPTSALLRAVLVNGAAPLHGALVPNSNQGWGRLNVAMAVGVGANVAALRVFEEDVGQGAEFRTTLRMAGPGGPVRTTLAWTDPPGRQLVSDLDLIVRCGGREWHGNRKAGETACDRVNNVERVLLDAVSGELEITVRAVRLDTARQAFGLAVLGALE